MQSSHCHFFSRQVFNKQDGLRTGLAKFTGGWVTCILQLQGLVLAGDSRGRVTVFSSNLDAAPITAIQVVKHAPVQSLQVRSALVNSPLNLIQAFVNTPYALFIRTYIFLSFVFSE